jgi:trimeric autotransporter adhesin
MASDLTRTCVLGLAAWLVAPALPASEYQGTVSAGGLPIPGAMITAVQGERRVVTTSDDRGRFAFTELADGRWTIEVEMVGFAKVAREVVVTPDTEAGRWELRFLMPQSPSGARRVQPRPANQTSEYLRLDVSQSAESGTFLQEGALRSEEVADLNQSAASSFLVQGSVSSALGMGPQNDWGLGPPGMGLMGRPGMELGAPGAGGLGGEGQAAQQEGGPRAAMGSGRGGPGGGAPLGGGPGRGGPGGMNGGPREFGRGLGGPGRPDWQGRAGAMAFGNARRDRRNMYMGGLNFSLGNSVWDARSYSVTGASVDKPAYASSRGGIMFGGPLRIPKLVSAEKQIMFTIDVQFQRNRTGTVSQPVNVPTELERGGDFSQTLLSGAAAAIYDPASGALFPGNKIPADRISSSAATLLQFYPNPNLPFARQNYQTSWNGVNNSHNVNSRVSNIRLTGRDRLNGGIGYQGASSTTPNLFKFIDTGSSRAVNATLAWSHNFSSRLINNVRYNFSRNRQELTPYFANRLNVAAMANIAGTSQNPVNWGPPNLNFINYAGLTDGNAALNRNQTSSAGDSLLWVHGRHNMSVGGDYTRQQFNQLSDSNARGTYAFNGSATSYVLEGAPVTGSGYDLADFLLSAPATGSIRYGNSDKYFRGANLGFYVNDDWRISSRLSLNGGVRWDYAAPVTELYNRLVNLDVAPGYVAVSPVLAGESGAYSGALPSALIRPDRNNFSPRIGFAWRPANKRSMVVRGGYGIYYNTSVYNQITSNMAQQPPFAQVLSASSSPSNPLTIENGFLQASTEAAFSTFAIDPNYRIGYAQTWNFMVQHDLPFSLFGSAGYLGTKGTRLDQQFIPNSVPPGAAESVLPHGFIYESSNGNSIYHAAQFQLNRRFHSGIMAHASYQFSKSIDDAGTRGRGQGGTPVAQNWLDLSAERGLSSFDSRHNLSVRFQYSTGMGVSGGTLLSGWKGALFKDWTISGDISLRSGSPFTAIVGGNRSQVSGTAISNTVRADATGLPVSVAGMLFNTAAFSEPLAGLWGSAGRNTIPGPTTFYLNGAVGRIFRLGERRSIDIQWQAQNLLNYVTINSWGTVLGASNYGLATGAAAMRRMTVNLRVRF